MKQKKNKKKIIIDLIYFPFIEALASQHTARKPAQNIQQGYLYQNTQVKSNDFCCLLTLKGKCT